MEDTPNSRSSRRLLTKRKENTGPPVAYNNKNNTLLKRSPSAPGAFNPAGAAPLGVIQPSFTSSLRRSPSQQLAPVSESSHATFPSAQPPFAHLPLSSVGPPFNSGAQVEEALAATQRPPPPAHYHTFDGSSQYRSPQLKQSNSFTALRAKMDTPPSGSKSPRARYSGDDGDKWKRNSTGKKKGSFTAFMSHLVSSSRRPTISTPTNPMHVTHVSIDNETGEFTVRMLPFAASPVR
jgi:p21-activated kinase 1